MIIERDTHKTLQCSLALAEISALLPIKVLHQGGSFEKKYCFSLIHPRPVMELKALRRCTLGICTLKQRAKTGTCMISCFCCDVRGSLPWIFISPIDREYIWGGGGAAVCAVTRGSGQQEGTEHNYNTDHMDVIPCPHSFLKQVSLNLVWTHRLGTHTLFLSFPAWYV